jgi:hypothetical protein
VTISPQVRETGTMTDGRFIPLYACRECLRETFETYVLDFTEGRLIPMHIEPVNRPAWDRRVTDVPAQQEER